MKHKRKLFAAASALAVLSAVMLAGCGSETATSQQAAVQNTGVLTLSVNPEIQIQYDAAGNVTSVAGRNAEGQSIVQEYQGYIGKSCDVVLKDLVAEIEQAGYFVEDVNGNKKDIVLQLEPGSAIPRDNFLADMSESTQEAVQQLSLASDIVTINNDDYDPNYAKDGQPSPYITLEKAQEIALSQANISASDAVFDDKDFDHDDGTATFELEFVAGGREYEYDIDAVTGKVLRAEHLGASAAASGTASSASSAASSAPAPAASSAPAATPAPSSAPATTTTPNTPVTPPAAVDTDYGPGNDGVTDYNNTDYGPGSDGVTDYNNTDYGPGSDGVTDYNNTDYGPGSDGVTNYGSSNYGNTNYGSSNYSAGDSGYDD